MEESMRLLHEQFQEKLTFRFGMLNCQLGHRILNTSTFISWGILSKDRVHLDNLQTNTGLKEAIGE